MNGIVYVQLMCYGIRELCNSCVMLVIVLAFVVVVACVCAIMCFVCVHGC